MKADSSVAQACLQMLALPSSALPRLLLLYCCLVPHKSLWTCLTDCGFPVDDPPFDLQRFIAFGLLNGIVRRVQPFVVQQGSCEEVSLDQCLVDSGSPLDEQSYIALLDRCSADPNVTVIWK